MEKEFWIVKILAVWALLIAAHYGIKCSLQGLRRRLLAKESGRKVAIDEILYLPLHIILWAIGVSYALEMVGHRFSLWVELTPFINVRNAIIVMTLAWILLKWKKEVQNLLTAKAVDRQMVFLIGRMGSVVIFVIAGITVLQILGLDVMPLVAFGGIGAAAIGFASKDVIANFCGGIMISVTRPFTMGDWIILPDRGIEAIVEEIGWYMTAVRDKEKRPVYLPNAIFSQQLVINNSRRSHRRILEKITIRYDDFSKLQPLVEGMKRVIGEHPRIDRHQPILVCLNCFQESAIELQVDVYTLATGYQEFFSVKHEVLAKIYEVILAEGAQMPFRTIHLTGLTETKRSID